MVKFNDVQAQLMGLNSHFRFIGIAELKQLACALQPGEKIMDCLKGWHNGQVSVLCATDKRLIIVDKKTTRDSVQEIDYVGIEKIEHFDKGWSSVINVEMSDRMYEFVSWHIKRLKQMHIFVQRHRDYLKSQAEAAQELVDKVRFEPKIRPKTTPRNLAVFAQRLGNSSLS